MSVGFDERKWENWGRRRADLVILESGDAEKGWRALSAMLQSQGCS